MRREKRGGGKLRGGGGCKDNQCSRQWAAWWSRQRRSFSRGRRPETARTTRPTPVYLHRRLAGHPAPGCHCRSRTQAGAAVPRRASQLPVEAAVAPRCTLLRREYGAGCRHNPPGVPAGGARKDAAVGGAEGGRELGLRRAIGSARAHRAEELAVDKKACKEGGLTVEQGGAGPVVASGGAVR